MSVMTLPPNLDELTADELRELVLSQAAVITRNDQELNWRQAKIDKLTHEVAYYKRHYFGVKAERLPVEQGQLFEETIAADMAAMTEELAQLSETKPKGQAKRKPLPPELPRTEIHHEPESTTCACGCQMKRIGEDKWVVMYDIYGINPHNFGFSETTDFVNFKDLGRFNEGVMKATNFSSPKHGAVIHITKKEAEKLRKYWKNK